LPPAPKPKPSHDETVRASIRDYTRIVDLAGSARADVVEAIAKRALAHAEIGALDEALVDCARIGAEEISLISSPLRERFELLGKSRRP
jgi:hypothetical protein